MQQEEGMEGLLDRLRPNDSDSDDEVRAVRGRGWQSCQAAHRHER